MRDPLESRLEDGVNVRLEIVNGEIVIEVTDLSDGEVFTLRAAPDGEARKFVAKAGSDFASIEAITLKDFFNKGE